MVSIIIPVYNGEEFLKETICSCLNQTYQEIEVIVVDDCSNDNSVKVVEALSTYDKRVKLIRNEKNLGFCGNANKGAGIASGEYLIVLGQDDMIPPHHVEKMVNSFKEGISVLYCDFDFIDVDSSIYEHKDNFNHNNVEMKDLVKSVTIHSCGLMMKMSCFKKVGGYPVFKEFPNYGEWYLWIKMREEGLIVYCEGTSGLYRRHKNNMTNTFNETSKKKQLVRYWDLCKIQAIKSKQLSITDKIRYAPKIGLRYLKHKII